MSGWSQRPPPNSNMNGRQDVQLNLVNFGQWAEVLRCQMDGNDRRQVGVLPHFRMEWGYRRLREHRPGSAGRSGERSGSPDTGRFPGRWTNSGREALRPRSPQARPRLKDAIFDSPRMFRESEMN